MYIISMRWTWHPAKSEWTQQDRGFDFDFAVQLFDGRIILSPTDRKGERRMHAIGMIGGKHYVVVYTKRVVDGVRVRHVISARRARDNEKAKYDA